MSASAVVAERRTTVSPNEPLDKCGCTLHRRRRQQQGRLQTRPRSLSWLVEHPTVVSPAMFPDISIAIPSVYKTSRQKKSGWKSLGESGASRILFDPRTIAELMSLRSQPHDFYSKSQR